MTETELLAFFKALADPNRLRIVGLLARSPASVEELAEALGLRPSTVSHHLAKLSEARLVIAEVEGHFHNYRLDSEALHAMARRLGSPEPVPPEALPDLAAWDRKVLSTFSDADGRFTQLPMQRKKFLVLLRRVLREFEVGRDYTEREVNDLLRRFSDDTASLRRGLVDHGMMSRVADGSRWWVSDIHP